MNAKKLIATVAVLAASSSAVAGTGYEYPHPANNFVSSKSRAEVAAEVKQARADGSLITNDALPSPVIPAGTMRHRGDVIAEHVKSVGNQTVDTNSLYFGS